MAFVGAALQHSQPRGLILQEKECSRAIQRTVTEWWGSKKYGKGSARNSIFPRHSSAFKWSQILVLDGIGKVSPRLRPPTTDLHLQVPYLQKSMQRSFGFGRMAGVTARSSLETEKGSYRIAADWECYSSILKLNWKTGFECMLCTRHVSGYLHSPFEAFERSFNLYSSSSSYPMYHLSMMYKLKNYGLPQHGCKSHRYGHMHVDPPKVLQRQAQEFFQSGLIHHDTDCTIHDTSSVQLLAQAENCSYIAYDTPFHSAWWSP